MRFHRIMGHKHSKKRHAPELSTATFPLPDELHHVTRWPRDTKPVPVVPETKSEEEDSPATKIQLEKATVPKGMTFPRLNTAVLDGMHKVSGGVPWVFPNDPVLQAAYDAFAKDPTSSMEMLRTTAHPVMKTEGAVANNDNLAELWKRLGFTGSPDALRIPDPAIYVLATFVLTIKWKMFSIKPTYLPSFKLGDRTLPVVSLQKYMAMKTWVLGEGVAHGFRFNYDSGARGIKFLTDDDVELVLYAGGSATDDLDALPWKQYIGKDALVRFRPFRADFKVPKDLRLNLSGAHDIRDTWFVKKTIVQGFVQLDDVGVKAEARVAVSTYAKSAPKTTHIINLFDAKTGVQDLHMRVRVKGLVVMEGSVLVA